MKDLRQRRTREAYQQAFWILLEKKPYQKITVTDFGEICGLNRKTFYSYYEEVDALAQDCLDRLFGWILVEDVENYTNWDATRIMFENIIRYQKYLELVLKNQMDYLVYRSLKRRMHRLAGRVMPKDQLFDPELLFEYTVAISWRCMVWGVKNKDRLPEELTDICLHTYRSYITLMANQYKSGGIR
ncbi:MAG: TetR/AcrR family transcriptional regulator [Lachnospiraceae bacterium]|nr:TetR/AcrR family transcriptional regulator [Lachnospiraceae bacterium]